MPSNSDQIDLNAPVVREFRVKSVRRFIVTDWADYRRGGVTEIAECASVEQANAIAEAFGKAFPGSLVNPMDPETIRAVNNMFIPPQPE